MTDPLNSNNNSDNNSDNNLDNNNKPELKRSFTESNNLDMNLEEEIRSLKKIIETQKTKISKLEKRQTSILKKGSQLEDAVNDLFDIVESEKDYFILNEDTDYDPDDDETEGFSFNIDAPNLEQFGKSLEENLNKLRDLENQVPPHRKKGGKNQIEIELSQDELKKIKSGADDTVIQNIVKKSKQKADPLGYAREYCTNQKWSKSRTTKLINQVKEYISFVGSTELEFFIESPETKRKEIIKSLQELKSITTTDTPYKFRILSSAMDLYSKKVALYKTEQLTNSEPGSGDYYKLKNWLDTLLDIPWGEHKYINVNDAMVPSFLANARSVMNTVIHGQDETKDIIIQIISKMITNPGKCGNVFAIYGPPGVGKTTIIKDGMSKALGIPFAFLSLGGATDSSYLDGHGYTYEGSTPGKIVDILRKVKCMNPIFYFDELDKVSETRKGEEVANLLIHLTDPSQNTLFQDKYLGNINLDISKSIFVFSFNDIKKVNPILLDRMELIYVKGFTPEEKLAITRNYILPELFETYKLFLDGVPPSLKLSSTPKGCDNETFEVALGCKRNLDPTVSATKEPAVVFSDANLEYIINYENLSANEQGVRQIKRRFEKICSQLNIIKLVKGVWTQQSIHSILDKLPEFTKGAVKWPLSLSNDTLDILLKVKSTADEKTPFGMYC